MTVALVICVFFSLCQNGICLWQMVVLILDLINSSAVPNEMETANRKTEMGKGKIENGKPRSCLAVGHDL